MTTILLALLIVVLGTALTLMILARRSGTSKFTEQVEMPADAGYAGDGIIGFCNRNPIMIRIGSIAKTTKLERIFNLARNPWGMSYTTFTAVRVLSVVVGVILAGILFAIEPITCVFGIMLGAIGFWYPMYYYKAVGKEREEEWTKLYQFIWVVSNNAMMYDARKVFLNTGQYINDHHPEYKEMIQGFSDFYTYWDPEEIPAYIKRYYFEFPIPKEIYRMMFTMNATGTFPEAQLDAFRSFIVNQQNMRVEKVLSTVSSKATLASLPFLMASTVVALIVPFIAIFLEVL